MKSKLFKFKQYEVNSQTVMASMSGGGGEGGCTSICCDTCFQFESDVNEAIDCCFTCYDLCTGTGGGTGGSTGGIFQTT